MDLDLTSRGCKGHPKLIIAPTNLLLCLLQVPLLILPGLCLLHGLTHLNTILSPLLIRFTHLSNHSLSGMHLNRGGGPSTTLPPPFCLHHQLSHSHYLLLLQDNTKCLLNRTRTPKTDRPSRYIWEKQHALPMLWRFRRSTCDLERLFRIANLLPQRTRKINRKVNQKPFHPFLRD